MKSSWQRLIPFLPLFCNCQFQNSTQFLTTTNSMLLLRSRSHIATDRQSVSLGVIFITVWQLRSSFCGAPSLRRGRACLFYMLLVLVSAIFLGSDSVGTRDHILLSQIWDFPFRRFLRLAGSRWRYSTLPLPASELFFITTLHGPRTCLLLRCLSVDVLLLRMFASAGMCLPRRCLAVGIHVKICCNGWIWCFSCRVLLLASDC
jgi:hypothetical protein